MIKKIKNVLLVLIVASATVSAQTTTNSPYSNLGIGNLVGPVLPQNRALGGITGGLRQVGSYFNLNPANPASYAALRLTTFDIGARAGFNTLSKGGVSETGFNGSLSHIAFGIPISSKSAVSFGLLPYSEIGYHSQRDTSISLNGDPYSYNFVSTGEGGVSKAYVGYGFQIGKNFSFGANVSYLFGNLNKSIAAEFPRDAAALSNRTVNSTTVGGFSFDYGVQYAANLSKKTRLTLGYSGTAKSDINSKSGRVQTQYRVTEAGEEGLTIDTLTNIEGEKTKITLPTTHTIGFTFERTNKFLIGADFRTGQWSQFKQAGVSQNLQDTYGISVGTQYTPDITAVSNYFKLVDYRLGFNYDKTYVKLSGTDIKQNALTVGLGLPLPSNRSSFYKINIGAEIGTRGTLSNSLVKERYTNIYLGFTLNDKWFQKYKFD